MSTQSVASREGVETPALRRVRFAARLLDDAFRVPGTNVRFGLDPVLGLLPVGGDAVAGLVSLYIVFEGARAGLAPSTLVVMLLIVVADVLVGSIPVLGTAFDAVWKANKRNVAIIERSIEARPSGSRSTV
ncbi:DUF4112 domain-containing protein [Halobacteriales archaeon QS_1_68_17]|nr:MAG: DUF4112 domain-containing protein [Halobacteriales archaeon QS_1_68_17]